MDTGSVERQKEDFDNKAVIAEHRLHNPDELYPLPEARFQADDDQYSAFERIEMNRFIFKISSTALLLTGWGAFPQDSNAQDTAVPVPARANENDPDSQIYRASDVIGLPVRDDQKQEIGKIKDLVINGSTREVLYAVVGMNEGKEKDSVYVMPWNQFQPSFGQGNAIQYTVLTVPQTVWLQAPYWSMSQWRQMPYSQWSPRVNQYFQAHIQTNTASKSRPSSVTTNKPVLSPNEDKNKTPSASDKDKPAKDTKPQPKTEANDKTDEPKSKPSTKPATKPEPEPKAAAKPERANADNPAPPKPRDPKTPAPK